MLIKDFFVDKTTNTFSDDLKMAGFLRLLHELFHYQQVASNIVCRDLGYCYHIQCVPPLNIEEVRTLTSPFWIIPILQTKGNNKKLPDNLPIKDDVTLVDFEEKKMEKDKYHDIWNSLSDTAKRADRLSQDNSELQILPPFNRRRWEIFRVLNTPTALPGYNNIMLEWNEVAFSNLSGQASFVLCQMFSNTPNDLETAQKTWSEIVRAENNLALVKTSASQILDPAQGKGLWYSLPNNVKPTSYKHEFWLLKWLKFIGFYEVGFTREIRKASSNDKRKIIGRKTYVPVFGHSNARLFKEVQRKFHRLMRYEETLIRSDILTILRYLRAFIQYVEEARSNQADTERQQVLHLMGEKVKPANHIRGFQAVYYKNLSDKAVTTMNMAFLRLPGWISIQDARDAIELVEILKEHEKIINQFVEHQGSDQDMLNLYRNFIVADDLGSFFDFTNSYSNYIISQREKRNGFAHQFQVNYLRRLLMSNDEERFAGILENNGFINVARAIRESTVKAQWEKAKTRSGKPADTRYNVRYGLGQDLIRRSQYPKEFLSALHEFMQTYNAENFQIKEREANRGKDIYKTYFRPDLYDSDFQEIVQLIDKYESDLICKMLVAYGYARESRNQEDNQEQETN